MGFGQIEFVGRANSIAVFGARGRDVPEPICPASSSVGTNHFAWQHHTRRVGMAIHGQHVPAVLEELSPNGGWSKADYDERAVDVRIQGRQPS
jgi:hypothetical protein